MDFETKKNCLKKIILEQYNLHQLYNDVLEQLETLHQKYKNPNDYRLFLQELSLSEFWQYRTLIRNHDGAAIYWNPTVESFISFSTRIQAIGLSLGSINVFEKDSPYPPLDVVLVYISDIFNRVSILHAK